MKRLLLYIVTFVLPLLANAQGTEVGGQNSTSSKSITIYVKASEAPYLYVWNDTQGDTPFNGKWSDVKPMTETKEVKGTTFYYQTFTPSTGSINIIFHNGKGTQTDNIENVTFDSFYDYDISKQDDKGKVIPTNLTAKYCLIDVLPSYKRGEICAFFEVPASHEASYETVKAHVWGGSVSTNWPGDACTLYNTLANGNKVWKWTCSSADGQPANIIFNNGDPANDKVQTADMEFVNGGYYKTITATWKEDCSTGRVAEREGDQQDIEEREFTAKQYATVCLPFDVSAEEMAQLKGDFYEYTSEADGVLTFTGVKELKAWTPYVYIASEDGKNLASIFEKTIGEGSPKEVTNGDFTFKGTYTRKNLISNDTKTYYGYKKADGTFVKVGTTNGANINPWQAYFITSTSGGVEAKSSSFTGGETTGIGSVKRILDTVSDDAVYTIDGKKMGTQALPRGLYIYKGKKLIVK